MSLIVAAVNGELFLQCVGLSSLRDGLVVAVEKL